MSCTPGGGCCAACGGLSGFALPYDTPTELNASETDELLSRNPSISARVIEWNTLVSTLEWSQVYEAGGLFSWTFSMPGAIPSEGIRFEDSVYGRVIIFPDAHGTLHFIVGYSGDVGVPVGTTGLPQLPNIGSLVALATLVFGFLILREIA
jgi:hypothetical protein